MPDSWAAQNPTETADEILADIQGKLTAPPAPEEAPAPAPEPVPEEPPAAPEPREEAPAQLTEKPAEPPAIQLSLERVERDVKTLADAYIKTTAEVREMHKLYHNEYADRLKSMQDELERYREVDKGRIFDGVLTEVAKLYSDYESLPDDIAEEKIKKRMRYMLEDIVQILEANGVFRQKSQPGDKRSTRHCRVIERVATNDAALHDTVALSRGTGFYIENRSLIKEPVDIYLYAEAAADQTDQSSEI